MGAGVYRSLCRGVPRLCRAPLCLRAVDGGRPVALRRPDRRPAVSADAGQHAAVCRARREPQDVPGAAVVGVLSAPAPNDPPSTEIYTAADTLPLHDALR